MWDNILLALQSLSTNKMRALLTMLGIIIGIASVIAIETVGDSLSGTISDSMTGFGASDITVMVTEKEEDDNPFGVQMRLFRQSAVPNEASRITAEMIEDYTAAFPNQVAGIKLTESVGTATVAKSDEKLSLSGWNDDAQEAEDLNLLSGRLLQNETDGDRKICLVADTFVEDVLGMKPTEAVGTPIRVTVGRVPYVLYIVGVYEYDDTNVGLTMAFAFGDTPTNGYIPLETARSMTGAANGYGSLTVVTKAGVDASAFMQTTENFFATFYTRNTEWTAKATSLESLVSTMMDILDKVSLAISAIAAISLLVGGIGVMNIMLVSVTERTREIGTRKALGAPQRTIRMQFIVEAMVICLIGGIIGILLGIGLGVVVCDFLGYPAMADPGTILLVVAISMGIGIFFGYYPANKASKLDPIEALRYE